MSYPAYQGHIYPNELLNKVYIDHLECDEFAPCDEREIRGYIFMHKKEVCKQYGIDIKDIERIMYMPQYNF